MNHIRLVVADAHESFRERVRRVLEPEEDIELAGEAGNWDEALRVIGACQPDVVFLDPDLNDERPHPARDVSAVMDHILGVSTNSNVLVFITPNSERPEEWHDLLRMGYYTRMISDQALITVIRRASRGEWVRPEDRLSDPALAEYVNTRFLSPRQREVLALIAQGKSSKEIATELCVSLQTVMNHLTCILRRLNARDRTHAASIALIYRLIDPPDVPELTDEDRWVLELMSRDLPCPAMTETLHLQEGTIRYSTFRIFCHLHLWDRAEAVRMARERGWLP